MSTADIAVQLYTVRSALAADGEATIARLAEIGYAIVEPYNFADHAEALLALLRRHDLHALSGHSPLFGVDATKVFDAADVLGITTVIDPYLPPETWANRSQVLKAAAELNNLAASAGQRGLSVGYHNHWWEFGELDGEPAFDLFVRSLDESVVLEIDTYWVEQAGASSVELLGRLGSRVRFIHVKDGPATEPDAVQTAVGAGSLDIPSILAAAPRALHVVELDQIDGDVFVQLAQSMDYLRAIAGRH